MSSAAEFVLEVRGLRKTFTQGWWWQRKFQRRVLENVNLTLRPAATLALVGRSGCGKTTLAMCLVGLETPDAGEIFLDGINLQALDKAATVLARRGIQLVFQDSSGALNPRMSAIEIVEEPMLISGPWSRNERRDLASAMMERVGLSPDWGRRMPHEFSGGQRQRLAIARALVLQPKVLILDEIFVGLDLSIQGQIANLLLDLQQFQKLSYICISHNFALVGQIADTIAFMEEGQIVEQVNLGGLAPGSYTSTTVTIDALRQGPSALRAHSGA
jgi:ABC-type glutathione transport system ATPase component